jgi:hypothetical protein
MNAVFASFLATGLVGLLVVLWAWRQRMFRKRWQRVLAVTALVLLRAAATAAGLPVLFAGLIELLLFPLVPFAHAGQWRGVGFSTGQGFLLGIIVALQAWFSWRWILGPTVSRSEEKEALLAKAERMKAWHASQRAKRSPQQPPPGP